MSGLNNVNHILYFNVVVNDLKIDSNLSLLIIFQCNFSVTVTCCVFWCIVENYIMLLLFSHIYKLHLIHSKTEFRFQNAHFASI